MSIPTIRPATSDDAGAIAFLLTELGHPTTQEAVAARWVDWHAEGNCALVSLDSAAKVTGAATLHVMTVLHRPYPVGRITALIVGKTLRGAGVGRALVAAAEALLAERGCKLMEITSNLRLTEAHAFYERIGYDRSSVRFSRPLGD
jgi:GNAT superfamily N-acetyltransferase